MKLSIRLLQQRRKMANKKRECRKDHCSEAPYLGGFCEKHEKEETEKERRSNNALKALETATIGGRLPDNPELRDELLRIRKWWFKACDALNYNQKDNVLLDDAKFATEWCIALALEIVDAEIAFRKNLPAPVSLQYTRDLVWDRFSNLEKGLMSNGVKRTT